jgi:glycosyltransferase involved in cell wall biosynthesis
MSASGEPEVSIVVPVHNALPYVRRLLRTLRRTEGIPNELIVVDNASRRATRSYLRAMSWRGWIDRLLLNDHNALFAAANNQAVRAADPGSRFVLLLNSDVEIRDPEWLRRLLELHCRGATSLGVIDDAAGVRGDGYCLLVDRDLYDRYGLDEQYAWWWCVSRLQAQLLCAGHRVTAVRDHERELVHHWAKSGDDFAGAPGMATDPATVRGWFGGHSADVVAALQGP